MTKEPTEKPEASEVDAAGSASAGPAGAASEGPASDGAEETTAADSQGNDSPPAADKPEPEQADADTDEVITVEKVVSAADAKAADARAAEAKAADDGDTGLFDAELGLLRNDLGELTRDLQRVTAEYANYRKRVDRDRTVVAEQATGAVLTQLLPVLDDLDLARKHGDLVGPFAGVADQLATALGKFGLTPFGDVGDPFDPTLHEAVAHMSSPDVTETACVEIMRRGYLLGDRLLRPALVAVADPE